jgi:autotransporter-associated beta strand protein
VFGNGHLDFFAESIIGSIEGDGIVSIPASLTVGSNDLSTSFSGIIESSGSLTKIGAGTLTLSGVNTYTGGTSVTQGTLLANTEGASATGTEAVHVNAGTLGGTSRLSGAIVVGSGTGPGAFLAPGIDGPATLTTRSRVTFLADGTYVCELSTTKRRADQITARGVQIVNGAVFSFVALGNHKLASGSTYTVINNTERRPISGAFSNLADGSTFTVGVNTYAVSYEGGSGNDLTLTVE